MYIPMSLKNIDWKMPNKILENRMHTYIIKITHHDKVDFILEIEGWSKIFKTINKCHTHVIDLSKNHIIMSINAEKAFHETQSACMKKFQRI